MLARHKSSNAVIENMLGARPPAVRLQMFERGDNAGRSERSALRRNPGCIEADRPLGLGRVEVAHIIDAGVRDRVEKIEGSVPMWIDKGNPLPCADVAHREIAHERGFSAAGFSGDINMPLTFVAAEYDGAAVGSPGNRNRVWLHNVAPASGESPCCLCSSRLPFVRWRSLWSRTPSRLAERPLVGSSR